MDDLSKKRLEELLKEWDDPLIKTLDVMRASLLRNRFAHILDVAKKNGVDKWDTEIFDIWMFFFCFRFSYILARSCSTVNMQLCDVEEILYTIKHLTLSYYLKE